MNFVVKCLKYIFPITPTTFLTLILYNYELKIKTRSNLVVKQEVKSVKSGSKTRVTWKIVKTVINPKHVTWKTKKKFNSFLLVLSDFRKKRKLILYP